MADIMKIQSARTSTWFAAILVLIGWLVMSPTGAFAVFVLAVIISAVPVVFGRGAVRVAAAVLLLLSVLSATIKYPEFRHEREMYKDRHMKVSIK
jgi:membrane protein implicated in regulation of membrane protease activity